MSMSPPSSLHPSPAAHRFGLAAISPGNSSSCFGVGLPRAITSLACTSLAKTDFVQNAPTARTTGVTLKFNASLDRSRDGVIPLRDTYCAVMIPARPQRPRNVA